MEFNKQQFKDVRSKAQPKTRKQSNSEARSEPGFVITLSMRPILMGQKPVKIGLVGGLLAH